MFKTFLRYFRAAGSAHDPAEAAPQHIASHPSIAVTAIFTLIHPSLSFGESLPRLSIVHFFSRTVKMTRVSVSLTKRLLGLMTVRTHTIKHQGQACSRSAYVLTCATCLPRPRYMRGVGRSGPENSEFFRGLYCAI